jgi:hypothetical protein
MLGTIFFAIVSLISLFQQSSIMYFFHCISFSLMAWLSILAINLLNSNYPDRPVAGKLKTVFNWIFLLNFLLLAFLFGLIFSEYRELKVLSRMIGTPVFSLPFNILVVLCFNFVVLVFHCIILIGLYNLRRELYINFFRSKQFEFEGNGHG